MIIPAPAFLTRPDRPTLAYRHLPGTAPTVVFLPGYMSDMSGSKAAALIADCAARGQSCVLFDYAGCGLSEGRFADQTLIDWRSDVLDLIAARVPGPVVLVGSSMGGWVMLLAALALPPAQVAGLVGVAAAPDFTEWAFSDAQKAVIHTEGMLLQDTPYGAEPYVTTRALWQSGHDHLLLGGPIALTCPVHLLHGQRDDDVPWRIALRLADALASDDVTITLVKDGDHRLSRDRDIGLLLDAVARMAPVD